MATMIKKKSDEIRNEWTPEKLRALAETAPSFPDETTDEDMATGRVRRIGRGFAAFKECTNRNSRPKVEDKRVAVSIRLPNSDVEKLRALGKGWQTRVGEYLINGIRNGKIANG